MVDENATGSVNFLPGRAATAAQGAKERLSTSSSRPNVIPRERLERRVENPLKDARG
jgi:hypothetical protein